MSPPTPEVQDPRACQNGSFAPTSDFSAISWHRIWLGAAIFLFGLLCLTGLLLMTVYTPSTTHAWGSVWYIQTQMSGGWFIRGLHRFSSDALMLVLPVYLLHLLLTKVYRPPGHIGWWIGWLSLGVTMAAALSGYLLPWDQRGYWGMKVRLNIVAMTPIVGDWLRDFLIGGSEMGSLTLTRFYTLHIMILPLALVLLLGYMRRKRSFPNPTLSPAGMDRSVEASEDSPLQRLVQVLTCLIVFSIIAFAARYALQFRGLPSWRVPYWPNSLLEAPADPAASDYPARPEWFNLFLFQWLKYFHGPNMEVIGAIFVPGAMIAALLALPYLHRVTRRFGRRRDGFVHALATGYVLFLGIGVVWLTYAAIRDDKKPPDAVVRQIVAKRAAGEPLAAEEEVTLRARDFNQQRWLWKYKATLAAMLANESGIPPEGALSLLQNNPYLRAAELFATHCAVCHRFIGHNGLGIVPDEPATSSDLGGYSSQNWIRGLLTNPMDDRYFGRMKKPDGTPAHTRMSRFLKELREGQPDDAARQELEANLDAVAAYLADESLNPGRWAPSEISNLNSEIRDHRESNATSTPPESANHLAPTDSPETVHPSTIDPYAFDELFKRGREFFMSTCNECHSYRGQRFGTFSAPEMYGYGSVEWIELMIAEPGHESRYRSTGREPAQMPPFRDRLSPQEIKLIAQLIHGVE